MNKKFFGLALALGFLCSALTVSASEVTGSLSTGIGNGVQGVVITAPSASPAAGTYTSSQNVSLSATGSQSIHYALDGTTPSCSTGTTYAASFAVNASKTVKALACYPNNATSSVATFAYVINLFVTPSQLSSLINTGAFALPGGAATSSTPSITATQQVTVAVSDNAGTSTVVLPDGVVITAVSGGAIDAAALTSAAPSEGSLSGLGSGTVVDGVLQWGIVNLGLQFSVPINISIFVGTGLNGQTLTVQRSVSGSGGWTSDGIVSPATCVVADGLCIFSATKASYYAVTHTPVSASTPAPSTNSGGGGGGLITAPPVKKGDVNKDGKIDVLDFVALMVNWSRTESSNVADLNGDGRVDILDFVALMVNWTR